MRLSLFVLASLCASSLAAHADIIGSSVTGGLFFSGNSTNYFDPANGFVPAGYGNSGGTTVTIGKGVEFGFADPNNTDTANFTSSQLQVKDVDSGDALPFEMTFTDTAFTGFTETSGLPAGYTYTFSGDTLDVFYDGSENPGTFTGSFSYASSVTPEPTSLALLGTGLLGVVGVVRRRFV